MERLGNRIQGILAGALLGGLFPGLSGPASAQTILHSFDGDKGPGLAVCQTGVTHCGFPDMNAAASRNQVVQATWQNLRIYDHNGRLLQTKPLGEFIRKAGLDPAPKQRRKPDGPSVPGPFEAQVVYNEFIDRWIMSVTAASDSLLVSASADAMGGWGGANLTCLEGGPCLDFNPALHLGYDKNGIYLCGGHLGDSNPNTIEGVAYDCVAVPTAEVRAIAQGKPPTHVIRVHSMPLDVFPVIDHNRKKAPDAPAFFLAKTCDRSLPGGCQNALNNSFQWIVDSFTWDGPTGAFNIGGEQLVNTDVGSGRNKWLYSKPCCGLQGIFPQAGNSAVSLRAAESHRLTNLVQFGSHVHGVMGSGPCTHDCGSQGTDTNNIAFWVDLDCSKPSACVVSQTAKIAGDFNPEFATIGVDSEGDVGIVAISATAKTNLSILLWTHLASDPPNTLKGPTTLLAGTQPYTCEEGRDYASIANPAGVLTALDPDEGKTLWVSHQWANEAAPCVWNTRIIGYQIASGPPIESGQPKPKKGKRR